MTRIRSSRSRPLRLTPTRQRGGSPPCWTAAEMEIDLWPRRCPPPLSGWNVVRWHFAGSASNARRFHRKPQRMRLPRPRWTWPAGWNAAIMDGSISASIPSCPTAATTHPSGCRIPWPGRWIAMRPPTPGFPCWNTLCSLLMNIARSMPGVCTTRTTRAGRQSQMPSKGA